MRTAISSPTRTSAKSSWRFSSGSGALSQRRRGPQATQRYRGVSGPFPRFYQAVIAPIPVLCSRQETHGPALTAGHHGGGRGRDMRNPFHEELTPSTGLERRIDEAIETHTVTQHERRLHTPNPAKSTRGRRSNRLFVLAAIAVAPLLGLLAVAIVSAGGLPLNVLSTGSSNVPNGAGHPAPLIGSADATSTPGVNALAAGTDVAVIPTPTIIVMPDARANTPNVCMPVNAAGTPVANSDCPPPATPTPSSPSRPAPRNASAR